MQKIQGYEKLVERQQSQMEKLINEFDQQLNKVLKIKIQSNQIKILQTSKNLLKINQNPDKIYFQNIKLQQDKIQQESQKNNLLLSQQQKYQQIKYACDIKQNYDQLYSQQKKNLQQIIFLQNNQIIKIKKNLQSIMIQIQQKNQQIYSKNQQIIKNKKKYQQLKLSFNIKYQQIKQQSYNNFLEIRRLKIILHELYKQLENKNRQSPLFQQILIQNKINQNFQLYRPQSTHNANQQFSFDHSIIPKKFSIKNQQYKYQLSQIDTINQKKNDDLLRKAKFEIQLHQPGLELYPPRVSQHSVQVAPAKFWGKPIKAEIKDYNRSFEENNLNLSSVSCQLNLLNSNSYKSLSNKDSFQGYGIRNSHKDRTPELNNTSILLSSKNSQQEEQ